MLITLGISIKPVLLSGKNENMWAGIAKFGFFFSKKKDLRVLLMRQMKIFLSNYYHLVINIATS